jgi:CHAT domain-containing protein
MNYYNPISKSGRKLSKPPPAKYTKISQKKWDNWLIAEAKLEATKYELNLLNFVKDKKGNFILSSADYDTINLILFGDINDTINYDTSGTR